MGKSEKYVAFFIRPLFRVQKLGKKSWFFGRVKARKNAFEIINYLTLTCFGFSFILRSTDCGHPLKPFSIEIITFGLEQTNWADKFRGILGVVSAKLPRPILALVHTFHYSIIILKKKSSLPIHIHCIYLGLGFKFGRTEVGI